MLDLALVLTKNPNAAYRLYDGQATVVLPDRAEVNVINEVGSLVWERIDGKRTLGEILDAVVQEYGISRDQAERDVREFVDDLRRHALVS
jgi:hypothetical protein